MTAAHRVLHPADVRDQQAAALWAATIATILPRIAAHDAGTAPVPAGVARVWRALVAPEVIR